MAPIPDETHALISAAKRRCGHISEVEIPKLRSCTGPLAVQQTVAEELREDTVLLTRQIEVYLPCNW
jgi:protein transport protein SEC20